MQIIQAILAIKEIFSMIGSVISWFKKYEAEQSERKHQDAKTKLEGAKNAESIKDAARDYIRNP